MTPEQHADTVRETLVRVAANKVNLRRELSALDELVALAERADTLERERDEAQQWWEDNFATPDDEPPDPDTAQMLDFLFRWGNSAWGAAGQESQRAEQARAEADRLQEALREIAGYEHPLGMSTRDSFDRAQEIARAALAGTGPSEADRLREALRRASIVKEWAAPPGPQTKEQTT